MRYLVTYTENGCHKAFYTEWFDVDNFNPEVNMKVYDLACHNFTVDGVNWINVEFDNL